MNRQVLSYGPQNLVAPDPAILNPKPKPETRSPKALHPESKSATLSPRA